ncbi:MAG: hypothetical protein ACK4UR_00780 [Caldimicrobium sp.]
MGKLFFFITLLVLVCFAFYSVHGKKVQIMSQAKINLFCRQIQPNNLYCPKWLETQQKLLQLKDFLYAEIIKYCESHKDSKFCKEKNKRDISTFCNRIDTENEYCQQWQTLKQLELETKGFLLEEIQNFCQKNPLHQFCK